MKGVLGFNPKVKGLLEVLIQGAKEKLTGSLVVDLIIGIVEG
jgi:hypothetical protein